MAVTNASIIVAALVILVLAAWYSVANRRWIGLVHDRQPSLAVDAVAQPREWATTAPSRLRRTWEFFTAPSDDPDLEHARLCTVHRAVVAALLGPLALVGLPVLATVVVTFARTEIDRGGIVGVGILMALIGVIAYWAWRLARTTIRYGNGESVRVSEVIVPIAGIAAAGLMAAFMAATPVGRGG